MRIGPTSAKPHPAIISEASAWFIEFRADDVKGEARERFIEWLRRSPEHIQAYLEVSGAWAELPTSDPEGKIDLAALLARSHREPDIVTLSIENARQSPLPTQTPSRRSAHPRLLAIAASVLLASVLGVLAVGYFAGLYGTGIGEQLTIQLADGSTVELNARSKIRVSLERHERRVALLEGQALFHVAKDARRPFVVRAGETQVRAVGTEFDVYRKATGTVVTVVEGLVSVSAPEIASGETAQVSPDRAGMRSDPSAGAGAAMPAVFVSAGQQLTVSAQAVATPKPADAAAATAWVQKRLMFEETPLSEVADEFNRYNTRPLVIEDPQVAQLKISGIYSSTDPASLLNFLRSQASIQVFEDEREVRIIHREAH
jgi:transmembrane sensor